MIQQAGSLAQLDYLPEGNEFVGVAAAQSDPEGQATGARNRPRITPPWYVVDRLLLWLVVLLCDVMGQEAAAGVRVRASARVRAGVARSGVRVAIACSSSGMAWSGWSWSMCQAARSVWVTACQYG